MLENIVRDVIDAANGLTSTRGRYALVHSMMPAQVRAKHGCGAFVGLVSLLALLKIARDGNAGPTLNMFPMSLPSPTLKYMLFSSSAAVNEWLHIGYTPPRAYFGHVAGDTVITAETTRKRAVPVLAESLHRFFLNETAHTPKKPLLTLVDVGCATGYVPIKLNTIDGIFAVGVDGSAGVELLGERYRKADLASPLQIHADWVTTFEVGEHIPVASQALFFRTIKQAKRGVIMSWARPGQGGNGHINELSVSKVIHEMTHDEKGSNGRRSSQLVYDPAAVALLQTVLGKETLAGFRYAANILAFRRVYDADASKAATARAPCEDAANGVDRVMTGSILPQEKHHVEHAAKAAKAAEGPRPPAERSKRPKKAPSAPRAQRLALTERAPNA